MKTLYLFLTLFFSLTAAAYEVPANFLEKWTATPLQESKVNGETTKAKVFQRYLRINGLLFPVGTVTFFQVPSKKGEALTQNTINHMVKTFGDTKTWTVRKRQGSTVVEGPWVNGNRYIRYHVTPLDGSMVVSMASYRFGYQDSVGPESFHIQEEMARLAKERKTSSFWNFISPVSEAYAQPLSWPIFPGSAPSSSGSNPTTSLNNMTNSVNQLNNNFGVLNNQLTGINGQMANTNTQMANANTQMANANNHLVNSNSHLNHANSQLSNANNNWANTNSQFANANNQISVANGHLSNANAQLSNTNAQIAVANQNANVQATNANANWAATNGQIAQGNQNFAEANKQWARTNDVAEKMSDPAHLAKIAAATTAAAIITSTVVTFAIDGIVSGVKAIANLISDAPNDEVRWERFVEAKKNWEDNAALSRKLETLLDNFLNAREMMKTIETHLAPEDRKNLTKEKLLEQLSLEGRIAEKRRKKLQAEFDETTDAQCEIKLGQELEEVEKLIASNENLKSVLAAQDFKVYNDQVFCNDLRNIVGKLGESEAELQRYRLNLLNAKEQWEEKNTERIKEMTRTVARLNDGDSSEDFADNRKDNANELYNTVRKGIQQHKQKWVDSCWDNTRKKRKITALNRSIAPNVKILKECEQVYDKQFKAANDKELAKAAQSKNSKKTAADRDLIRSRSRHLKIDTSVEDARLLSYYKFFSDIEEQQYCFTNRSDPRCAKAGEVKFLGPFYSMGRAQTKLKNVCGGEYNY